MRRRAALLLSTALLISLLGDGAAACASGHIQANLDVFPAEAVSRPLYWVTEGGTATFTIRVFGTSCDGTTVTVSYVIQNGTATSPADYTHPGSGSVTIVNGPGHSDIQPVNVTTTNEGLPVPPEPAVEHATILLTSATNARLVEPTSAPLLIVDANGASRPTLAAGPYEEQEGSLNGGVPVFRGGDTSSALPVQYSVTPGSATAGADYQAQGSGTVTIPSGQRSAIIPVAVVDDAERERNETLTVSIVGAGPQDTSSVPFTIRDNEESEKPSSNIHHPNNRKKYRNDDFRLREIHVFTSDNPGGSGVTTAQFALRRDLKKGKCAWWTGGKKFKKGGCDNPRWKKMGRFEQDFYYLRMKPLRPTKGKIKGYTAFSRAIDRAGNVEDDLGTGRNANTFKVRKAKKPRG